MVQQHPQYQQHVAPGYQPMAAIPRQNLAPVMSFGEWMLTLFVLWIPLIGSIMGLVWAFDATNPNRANFCKAALVWMVIGIVVGTLLWILVFAAMIGAVSGIE